MKKLLGLVFLFCAATVFSANPSLFIPWTAIRGTNGITATTNPSVGVVIFDPRAFTNDAGFSNRVIQLVNANAPSGPWTNSLGTVSNLVTLTQLVVTARAPDGTTPYTWNTVELHSGHLFKISTAQQTRFKLSALGGLAMGTTNNSSATISADIDGAIAIGQANDADSSISSGGPGGFSAGQALGGAYIEAGTASLAIGVVDGGGNFGSAFLSASPDTIGASFVFGTATNGSIVANGQGALAGGVASNGVVSADGLAGFTWGENVGNSGNNAFAFGKSFTNANHSTFALGVSGIQLAFTLTNGSIIQTNASASNYFGGSLITESNILTRGMFTASGPSNRVDNMTAFGGRILFNGSNTLDVGTTLLPARTNYSNRYFTPGIVGLSGTPAAWAFGSVVSNATVSANVTNYVEVAINGRLVKVLIANE